MVKNTSLTILIAFILSFPMSIVNAQSIDISLNQDTFKPGDHVEVEVSFTNPSDQRLKGQITCDFVAINQGLPPMPFMEEFDLDPNEKSQIFDFGMTIDSWMPDGLYKASIEVTDENDNIVAESFEEFTVTGTEKSIGSSLTICRDKSCSGQKVVFIRGETVFLKLDSSVPDLTTSSILTAPDGTESELFFKDGISSFIADDSGSYAVVLDISKDGYQDENIEKSISVIDSPASIESASGCDADGICGAGETSQSCPLDCPSGHDDNNPGNMIYAILLLIIVIILLIAIVAYKKKRENEKWSQLEQKMSEAYNRT